MKYFVLVATLVTMFSACLKSDKACTPKSPESEEAQIKAFMSANNINGVKHPSGLYYEIINPGAGPAPTLNSNIDVNYVGKFMNGNTFDQSSAPVALSLRQVIEGWQIGIPLIRKGGKIKLLIPSAYAYGCNDNRGIPGNSVLFFDVDLVDVK